MFERFTRSAREVVERAQSIALESRSSQIRPEHVLAAVLWDDESLAVGVLEDLGAPLGRLHEELDRRRGRYLDGLDDEDAAALASIGIDLAEVVSRLDEPQQGRRRGRVRIRFSRSTKKVLELALREAVSLRHDHIGTEHLLLGLVRVGDVTVRDTLTSCGIDPGDVRPAVTEAVRRAS